MNYDECIAEYGSYNSDFCSKFDGGPKNPFQVIGDFFGFIGDNFLWILLVIAILILIKKVFHIVPEKEARVVERLGRYHRVLQAGLRVTIPFIERVVHRIDLELRNIKVLSAVKTKDHQIVDLPLVATYRVVQKEAQKSVYEVKKPKKVLDALIGNEVKAKAATMTLEELFSERDQIKNAVIEKLTDVFANYGFELTNVVIDDPEISKAMEKAFNSVLVAEKHKEAAAAEGEAIRIKQVAEAEAEGKSLTIKADAYVVVRDKIAKGNAVAVKEMTGDTGLPPVAVLAFLAGIDRNDAIRTASENGATVVVGTANNDAATLGMIADLRQ